MEMCKKSIIRHIPGLNVNFYNKKEKRKMQVCLKLVFLCTAYILWHSLLLFSIIKYSCHRNIKNIKNQYLASNGSVKGPKYPEDWNIT